MQNNDREEDIFVIINGEKKKINSAKEEVAAADSDRTIDWSHRFRDSEQSSVETSGAGQNYHQSFHLSSPHKGKKRHKLTKKKLNKNRPSNNGVWKHHHVLFKKFWIPLISAIIIGLGFGFTILVFFSGQALEDGPSVSNAASVTDPGSTSNKSSPNEAGSSSAKLTVQQLTLDSYLLQAGAFDSASQADRLINQLSEKTIPAVKYKSGGYHRVFIGIASEQSGIDALSPFYSNQLKEAPYTKEISVTADNAEITNKGLFNFLTQGKDYLIKLSQLSASSSSIPSELKKQIANWGGSFANIQAKQAKSALKDFQKRLTAAASYNYKNKDDIKTAQEHLLNAWTAYAEVLQSYKNE